MRALTLAQLSALVGGRLEYVADTTAVCTDLVLDPADVIPGALYAQLAGPDDRADAGWQARRAGAVAVVATAARPGIPTVVVDDVDSAVHRLAQYTVGAIRHRVVVTGGPDSLPAAHLLAELLGTNGTVTGASLAGSLLAVPAALLEAGPETGYAVVDLDADRPEEFGRLLEVTDPQVVTLLPPSTGTVLTARVATEQAAARAYMPMLARLGSRDTVVVAAGDDRVRDLLATGSCRVLTYGIGDDVPADVRAEDLEADAQGRARFTLTHGESDDMAPVRLALHGPDHVLPALAAAAAALATGHRLDRIASALGHATLPSGCLQILTRPGSAHEVVVADACATGPDAVTAALHVLDRRAATAGRPRMAVLGEITGGRATTGHERVRRVAERLGVEVAAVGTLPAIRMSPQDRLCGSAELALSWGRGMLLGGPFGACSAVLVKGTGRQRLTAGHITADLGPQSSTAPQSLIAAFADACAAAGFDPTGAQCLHGPKNFWRLPGDGVLARADTVNLSGYTAAVLRSALWLDQHGVPVVRPARPEPSLTDRLCVSFWEDHGRWPARPVEVAPVLAAVHAASALAPWLRPHDPLRGLGTGLEQAIPETGRRAVEEHIADLAARFGSLAWPTAPVLIIGGSHTPNVRRALAGPARLVVDKILRIGQREWDLALVRCAVGAGKVHPDEHRAFVDTYEETTGLRGIGDWDGYSVLCDLIDLTEAVKAASRARPDTPTHVYAMQHLYDLIASQQDPDHPALPAPGRAL
ncbi:hypothetical protein [Kitasatospora sp. NPDC088548]|uniref:hypothetical protein n=1 Tax=Kitasatospora sp. NPDC088548 TaxID=3364075 RepID=UPI00380CA6E4